MLNIILFLIYGTFTCIKLLFLFLQFSRHNFFTVYFNIIISLIIFHILIFYFINFSLVIRCTNSDSLSLKYLIFTLLLIASFVLTSFFASKIIFSHTRAYIFLKACEYFSLIFKSLSNRGNVEMYIIPWIFLF